MNLNKKVVIFLIHEFEKQKVLWQVTFNTSKQKIMLEMKFQNPLTLT